MFLSATQRTYIFNTFPPVFRRLYLKKFADEDGIHNITVMPASTQIPNDLQLVLKGIVYSLRPAEACTVSTLNKKINSFLKTLPVIDRAQYFAEPFELDSNI